MLSSARAEPVILSQFKTVLEINLRRNVKATSGGFSNQPKLAILAG